MAANWTCAIHLPRLGPMVSDWVVNLELHSAASTVYFTCVDCRPSHDDGVAVRVGGSPSMGFVWDLAGRS